MAGVDAASTKPFLVSSIQTTETISLISVLYPCSKTCLADQDKKAEFTSIWKTILVIFCPSFF
ncbi:hypothetical protein II582_00875 [bacterium]|nr:hypothetical protein [bacterium]